MDDSIVEARQEARGKKQEKKQKEKIQNASELEAVSGVSADSPASVPEKSEDEAARAEDKAGDAIGTSGPDKQSPTPKKEKKSKKVQKQGKPKQRSKKYQEAQELVDRGKAYPVDEATKLVKEVSITKFDGSLEIHINTSVKNVRGLVNLPFASGKKLKILAFGKDAEDSGADLVGDDNALAEIIKGKIGFDELVTTAEWMPKLARAAKVLGPRGLMPNPKNGTISTDLKKTIAELQGGKTEYKTETRANVIHLGIGKLSQPEEELSQNIKLLLSTIGKTKIKKVTLSPTMGPAVKLDLNSI